MNREQKLAFIWGYARCLNSFDDTVEFEDFIEIINKKIIYSMEITNITQGELSDIIENYSCEVDNYTFNEKDGVIASCQYFVFINDEGKLAVDDDFDYDRDYDGTNETEYVLK
jgi:hypothetical protein